jgi:hypothetical protein
MKESKVGLITPMALILFLAINFLFTSCKSDIDRDEFQAIADRLSSKWVPDQREGIAEIKVLKSDDFIIIKGETDCPELKTELIDSLSATGYEVSDSILVLPGNDVGDFKYGVVTLSVINMRLTPGHSSELVSQAIMGTPVKILKNEDYWLLIQTPDNYIAWSEKGSFQLMTEPEFGEWKNADKVICIENSGWIYENIEEKGVIGDFVAGSVMKSKGQKGGFENVILPDGRSGFIRVKMITEFGKWVNNSKPESQEIIRVASSFTGIPYLWGGSSSKGVDCSGFTQSVYFMNGIILSRDASLQALHGQPVDISNGWDNLQTGDLMFFGSIRNSKPRVTHVAIYKGDSEFIHSAGRVMVNSLDSTRSNYSSYRKNSFLSARRILISFDNQGITAVRDHDWY